VLASDVFVCLCLIRVLTSVIDVELGTQEVGPNLAEIALSFLRQFFLFKTDQVVRGHVGASLLSIEQELISIRKGQDVLGVHSAHTALLSGD